MITNKEQVEKVFSIFHDGTICNFNKIGNNLKIKVDCLYLAQQINSEFEFFFIDLIGLKKIEFKPWSDKDYPLKVISDLKVISQWEYSIFTCNLDHGIYLLDVSVDNSFTSLIGGTLIIDCVGIKLFNHLLNEIHFEYLEKISNKYWDNFNGRN